MFCQNKVLVEYMIDGVTAFCHVSSIARDRRRCPPCPYRRSRRPRLTGAAWRRAWERVIPFFDFPPDVRRVICTTNAIESLHMRLRKIIETRGTSPGRLMGHDS
jgi:hypothetical protein